MTFIQALQKGDSQKIEEIYSTFFPLIKNIITKNNGTEVDALDIFQDSLITILINYKEVDIDFKFLLIRICKNKWIDQLRKRKVKSKFQSQNYSDHSTEDILINKEQEDQKFQLLESNFLKLSELCQQLITLIKSGIDNKSIAKKLNMTNANTIYRRKFACMKKWKELVENDSLYKTIIN